MGRLLSIQKKTRPLQLDQRHYGLNLFCSVLFQRVPLSWYKGFDASGSALSLVTPLLIWNSRSLYVRHLQ